MMPTVRVAIEDTSQVGEARRVASRIASTNGASDEAISNVSIVVTELGTNLLRHSKGGELLLNGQSRGVQVISVDRGPGIADLAQAFRDGYSSAGTSGNGLGAIRRQSKAFDVFSSPEKGTVISVSVGDSEGSTAPYGIGFVNVAYPGETECGDSWTMHVGKDALTLLVVDGAGHGPFAATAARTAVAVFEASEGKNSARYMNAAHEALKGGRGAAAGLATVDFTKLTVAYCGVGNISGHLIEATSSKGLVNQNGTLGMQINRISSLDYPISENAMLVLHSDGISNRWSLADYPGLFFKSAAVVAGVLYRDFGRGRDDQTVVVLRPFSQRVQNGGKIES